MTLTLVAAVGANGVIGRDGDLPWPRTGDLAHFKALTMGHVLVMGRATYDSIGRPLPGRTTVVLTRQPDWSVPGVLVARDLVSAVRLAHSIDSDVFIVGGASVYADAMPVADRLVLTHVEQSPPGDTYFPAVDWDDWHEVERVRYTGFSIATYDRRHNHRRASDRTASDRTAGDRTSR
jgi:dihydrofolate reductase